MGLADTTVVYNGVTLKNVLTRQFEQTNVLDESHTDSLHHRFVISVTGYVHPHPNSFSPTKVHGPFAEQSPIAAQHQDIRKRLMQNRGDFLMTIGNVELLRASAATDVNNGPHPKTLQIVHVGGRGMLRVEFQIEICKVECPNGSADPAAAGGVLNNRWSISEEFDANWYSTRMVRGRLRVARIDLNPQAFRGWVVPPLQRGFKRERMSFITAPNGLEMEYEITDKQVWAAAPAPALTWAASHSESTTDGVNAYGSITVRVEGPPRVDKHELFALAAQICEARLRLQRATKDILLEGVEITDPLHESAVEMRIRVRHQDKLPTYFGAIGNLMGKPISSEDLRGADYDQFVSRSPAAEDLTSPTGLFICYLQSPCSSEHSIQQVTDPPPEEDYGGDHGGGETQITETTGPLGTYSPYWSEEHSQSMYTMYTLENHYVGDATRVQLPVAKFSSSGEALAKTSVTVRLGAGVAQRVIVIDAERIGEWPQVPPAVDFEDATGRNRIITHRFINQAPRLAADGQSLVYSIRAAYLYSMDRPPQPEEISVPRMPYIATEADPKGITSETLSLDPR